MPQDIPGVMNEFKTGTLHSGSSTGKKVTNPKQAIAIALSEQAKQKGQIPKRGPRKFRRNSLTRVPDGNFGSTYSTDKEE